MSIRRDPWRDIASLRDAMNSLLDETATGAQAGLAAFSGSIPVDVRESREAFTIIAPLPGVRAEDVEISILGDAVRVAAELKDDTELAEGERWLVRERRFGRFERGIVLPAPVDSDGAEADFEAGVLTIRLPKIESARPKTIPVRGAGAR